MNIPLKNITPLDKQELAEPGSALYFFADSAVVDCNSIELRVGDTVVAAVIAPYREFEVAYAAVEDITVERPEGRTIQTDDFDEYELCFETPEELVKLYSLEELEWLAQSALAALNILNGPPKPFSAPQTLAGGDYALAALAEPVGGTQSLPRYLEPVGLLTKEEVAARFAIYNGKSA